MSDDTDRISAAQLRAVGCKIPDHIPDCATVPRTALIFGDPDVSMDEAKKDTCNISIPLNINAAFTWHETVFVVKPAEWVDLKSTLKELEAEGKIVLKDE
jgi:hypothetical protein